ncbi:uncharacterized protein [Typha latifolia]|uniref:uncharacterized protein isoform X1 n=1 Tax=Typha latifolia TaxID=4733 RepID=UPI003C2FFE37
MSLDSEDQSLPGSPCESEPGSRKKSRISYTREFLLSFSNLNICKKLPSGFDDSVLSVFEDAASNGVFERQRGLGGLSLHSKRGDYGMPQSRLEVSGNFSRGSSGRWDTRSSGSSDKDGDLLSERDESTMPDKNFGNQSKRFWQRTEHDGLLGSGAFARSTGHAGASAPKDRASGNYQLSRTTEPYQPPRPYKAAPFSRKDGHDSFNDETFGSAECASQDREEEERKRRASFESMRKEQHKALREKQKQIPENDKENLGDDIMKLLQNSVDKKSMANRNEKSDDTTSSSFSQNDVSRPSFITPAPPSRPLIPPGFTYANMDKTSYVQPSRNFLESEARNSTFEENVPVSGTETCQEKRNLSAATMDFNTSEAKSASILIKEEAAHLASPSSSSSPGVVTSIQSADYMTTGPLKAKQVWDDCVIDDCSNKKEPRSQITNPASQDNSTSILEKLFSTALSKNTGNLPTYIENKAPKANEETVVTADAESSKFARWFLEEEKETVEDLPSKDLLSLIATEKAVSVTSVSNDRNPDNMSQILPSENFDVALELLLPPVSTSVIGISEHHHQGDKSDTSPAILTCEDLEQFMLAEAENSSSSVQHPAQAPWTVDGKSEEPKVDVDNHASQHILSLLQKGRPSSSNLQVGSVDKAVISDLNTGLNTVENATGSKSETGNSSEKSSTLEALFGAAFMNELHSLEAPVSVQRAAGDLYDNNIPFSNGSPFSHEDNSFFPAHPDYYQSEKPNPGGQVAHLNHGQQRGACNVLGLGLEYEDAPVQGSNPGGASFNAGALDVHLPEEESLITVSDSLNALTPDLLPYANLNKPEELPTGKTIEVLNDKLLNLFVREEERAMGPDGLSRSRVMHDLVDSNYLYHHLQGRPSSDISHPMGHTRPTFSQLDHHSRNQQAKFIHRDPHHPLPNIIPHHAFSSGVGPQFDPTGHHLMLQQMPLPGNFPPQYAHQGMPRGGSLSHTIHQMPGYIPEMNNVHSILHHRQPAMPGPAFVDDGGTHPEALQRLIEMELRAKSKHIHPAAVDHVPSIYGPEFNMNFRYG